MYYSKSEMFWFSTNQGENDNLQNYHLIGVVRYNVVGGRVNIGFVAVNGFGSVQRSYSGYEIACLLLQENVITTCSERHQRLQTNIELHNSLGTSISGYTEYSAGRF